MNKFLLCFLLWSSIPHHLGFGKADFSDFLSDNFFGNSDEYSEDEPAGVEEEKNGPNAHLPNYHVNFTHEG